MALNSARERAPRLSLGHWAYRCVSTCLSGPVLAWLWWRGRLEPGYRQHWTERLGFVSPSPAAMGGLWVHVASVGEAQAALTLVEPLQQQWGTHAITWTTQTPAARALLLERSQGRIQACFAPLDTPGAVGRFLNRVQPRMLLLLERELWPEWLWQCEQRAVAVVVANARLKERSSERWPYNTDWMGQRLRSLQQVLCADAASAKRFERLGLSKELVLTLGNLKFDQAPAMPTDLATASGLTGRTVVVAASTHAADEDAILSGWLAWANANPQGLLVLAPRHPQRFAAVGQRLQADCGVHPGDGLAIRSQGHAITASTRIVLWDTIGELTQLYPSAQLCLMGGTWAAVGGHNALEPLSAGCPVLFGPHTDQFPDLYEPMAQAGAARSVAAADIWRHVHTCLNEPGLWASMRLAGLAFVAAQQGSARRTLGQLSTLRTWPLAPLPDVAVTGSAHDVVWTHLGQSTPLLPEAFELSTYGPASQGLATGSGRGQVHRVNRLGQTWVLRHYRRGGWVARFNPDRYRATSTHLSRAMQELALLREMVSLGLPVPEGVAARCERLKPAWGERSAYRADILVRCVPETRNLAQCLDQGPLLPEVWMAVGRAIARMHQHHIHHSDLNCHNLLLNPQGEVWLIDFDKCQRRSGEGWQASNLSRLLRSLRKERLRRPGFAWEEDHWAHVLDGYNKENT